MKTILDFYPIICCLKFKIVGDQLSLVEYSVVSLLTINIYENLALQTLQKAYFMF